MTCVIMLGEAGHATLYYNQKLHMVSSNFLNVEQTHIQE